MHTYIHLRPVLSILLHHACSMCDLVWFGMIELTTQSNTQPLPIFHIQTNNPELLLQPLHLTAEVDLLDGAKQSKDIKTKHVHDKFELITR